ncbi:hypothetical protein Athai_33480 [Actinocatenispora thailandica]|uniref:DoxX family protein n=1 Tax=Actinocatenispora thailandica TaxID=227318 RepID=A0A7R7DQ41_9ACTN|nr:DoxX family protein [Actinocatenispora thailandica]BCJ35845.1 hypothetical protein Athai_33480 [Actinocatenispora thailandica]
MSIGYLVVVVATAAATGAIGAAAAARAGFVRGFLTAVGVPDSWLPWLAAAKLAGAAGLLVGIAIRPLGVAAATGLVLYFVGAVAAHLRAHGYATLAFPATYLALAVASLVLSLG